MPVVAALAESLHVVVVVVVDDAVIDSGAGVGSECADVRVVAGEAVAARGRPLSHSFVVVVVVVAVDAEVAVAVG